MRAVSVCTFDVSVFLKPVNITHIVLVTNPMETRKNEENGNTLT